MVVWEGSGGGRVGKKRPGVQPCPRECGELIREACAERVVGAAGGEPLDEVFPFRPRRGLVALDVLVEGVLPGAGGLLQLRGPVGRRSPGSTWTAATGAG